ncbi:oligopeptide/dipeptide ABC transporter, ATPase subunit [Xylanimonas cellulosilytica DSM 15894]|uniref:Oligopeptide/dipeptide ABC transporter, ATPase subunit n=1 Tax=Xylanimonas cellulosilytica (strain DSM 15894 / JCM 12276 / CECT 5975 / KCTC 9989 / LMG 20990 / NBRC 107835 / XIL07) TaxID=446471 RepID=D1BUR4_XYLCX|nr:oligopeptide/dipeptide ABC transporter ATP-binding protein [Xylanimonas cellulosilytica]ACZ29305.1 oligopeptide/dipeptide ABC transporter, ATPase subunit [Xylanimonas cellulosilytica DSM 15894]
MTATASAPQTRETRTPVLSLDAVDKVYKVGTFGSGELRAVRSASLEVHAGEVVSLIGESGSGKSTIGKMVLHLVSTDGGTMRVGGQDVTRLKRGRLRDYYRDVQGVFQDPFSSFNPIYKVDRVFDTVRRSYFPKIRRADWHLKVDDALAAVTLRPEEILGKFPHQLSGGQLQRLLVARALLLDPKLLVADEIISMLDASTRVDVLNLLVELKHKGLGILFVTHDLSLGNYVSDRVVILYRGRIVESGETREVFENPLHPYTRDLLASVPQLDATWAEVEAQEAVRTRRLAGTCVFHSLAPSEPDAAEGLAQVTDGHQVGCFRLGADDPCPRHE